PTPVCATRCPRTPPLGLIAATFASGRGRVNVRAHSPVRHWLRGPSSQARRRAPDELELLGGDEVRGDVDDRSVVMLDRPRALEELVDVEDSTEEDPPPLVSAQEAQAIPCDHDVHVPARVEGHIDEPPEEPPAQEQPHEHDPPPPRRLGE